MSGYGALSDSDNQMISFAGQYAKSKLPEAINYTKEKLSEARSYAEHGDWSLRSAGLICAFLLSASSTMSLLGDLVFNPFGALIDVYLVFSGLIAALLEFKSFTISERYRAILRREALFLYRPYGRAAFYCFAGILEVSRSRYIIGLPVVLVSIAIYHYSRNAAAVIDQLKTGKYSEAEAIVRFKSFDRDNRGSLDSRELNLLCESLGQKLSDRELEAAQISLDPNGDGLVTLDEFLHWWNDRF